MQKVGLPVGEDDWVFTNKEGKLLPSSWLRWPMQYVLRKVGIRKRVTPHGFRRTLNNLLRQVAGEIVTRSVTGHVTQAMTEHYSHVGREEKLAAAASIAKLVPGLSSGGSSGGDAAANSPDTRSSEPNLLN